MVMATEKEREKETESIPSVKDLASSEPSARRKNLQQILSHLETRSPQNHLTHTQALQLWRGFHVALYMHDSKNQLSVQTLIATLAGTFKLIRRKDIELAAAAKTTSYPEPPPAATATNGSTVEDDFNGFDDNNNNDSPSNPATSSLDSNHDSPWLSVYSTAFWETMAREWSSVDQWRMNKYLLLIRFVLREIFEICLRSWFGLEEEEEEELEEEEEATTTKTISSDPPKRKKRKGTSDPNDDGPATAAPVAKHLKRAKKSDEPSNSSGITTMTTKTTIITTTPPSQTKPPSHTGPSTATSTSPSTTHHQLTILTTHPLSPRARSTPDGLRLHMLDIYTDELRRAYEGVVVIDTHAVPTTTVLRDAFSRPVREVARDGLARHVREKAKAVFVEVEEVWGGDRGE